MNKHRTQAPEQLSFDELVARLDERPGELLPLPVTPRDIGGELLAVLSKGLYTNPMDCIREYVQNAVDARASTVTIKITGNSVLISDNGGGMSLEELVQARQFGLSRKSLVENVGFRGIGIYSGFDLCKRLRVSSKRAGTELVHKLVFDFASMRAQLQADAGESSSQPKTPLLDLLSDHTRVGRDSGNFDVDHAFTVVELQDISDVHIRLLSNRPKLRRYLLQNLPIDFDDQFQYRSEINEQLYRHVPGYNAVKIILQSDGIADEVVAKESIPDLQRPKFDYIKTTSGHPVAFYWACMSEDRGKITTNRDRKKITTNDSTNGAQEDIPNYQGFVYKVKGFSIGDRQKLLPTFKRKPMLYGWYTGEIFVIDPNIVPNAERDDFETNNAKWALEIAVGAELSKLESDVEDFQARGVADERIDRYKEELVRVAAQIDTNTNESDFDTYSRLDEILRDIKRQRTKATASRKPEADEVVRRAEGLQRRLRKEIDAPTPEATRRSRAAKKEHAAPRASIPLVVSPPVAPPKTLPNVLCDAGWSLEGQLGQLVATVQSTLESVLGISSPPYRHIIDQIESRLANGTGEE